MAMGIKRRWEEKAEMTRRSRQRVDKCANWIKWSLHSSEMRGAEAAVEMKPGGVGAHDAEVKTKQVKRLICLQIAFHRRRLPTWINRSFYRRLTRYHRDFKFTVTRTDHDEPYALHKIWNRV